MEQYNYKQLLEKYYDGETNHQEEDSLKDYLRGYSGKDEEFIFAKNQIVGFDELKKETVEIDFNSITEKKQIIKFQKPIYNIISGIAAVAIVALVITVLINTQKNQIVYAYVDGKPITDKQIAMEHSKKALYHISSQLNKGTKGLSYVNKINKPVELLTVKK